MTKTPPTKPISIRLTPKERTALERRAGKRSLSVYVRERMFSDDAHQTKPSKGELAQALGKLGASGLAASLTDLAQAARIGALPVSEETENQLQAACADIAAMKSTLMKVLGIKER